MMMSPTLHRLFLSGVITWTVLFTILLPRAGTAEVLTADTVWQGQIELRDDILVPAGITLTVLPGTRITAWPSDSTKVDPEYLSHRTEITVQGFFDVQGTESLPILFEQSAEDRSEQWAGIIVDHGRARIRHATIRDADTAVQVIDGSLELEHGLLIENNYALIAQGASGIAKLNSCRLEKNEYGIFSLNNARILQQDTLITGNDKADTFAAGQGTLLVERRTFSVPQTKKITRIYQNDVLLNTTIWEGRIVVQGQVRLAAGARLVILPGTIIEFTKRDTNSDGIGENGIMIQGTLIAKGTRQQPILFRSAENEKNMGDWDSINILGSDQAQNLIEFCQIQDAYRGMHFHFSNVFVNNCILTNNFRAIQFQEAQVGIVHTDMYANKSGVRSRDSRVMFNHNRIFENLNGANFYRIALKAGDNLVANNGNEGVRIREGNVSFTDNMMLGNRSGLLINDADVGIFSGNMLSHNLETGLALRNTGAITIAENTIENNGINGIILRESNAQISGNMIADNHDRGIGVISFTGMITENSILNNSRYGIGLDGPGDVAAPLNWWGKSDLDAEIYDQADEAGLGRVLIEPRKEKPPPPLPPMNPPYIPGRTIL